MARKPRTVKAAPAADPVVSTTQLPANTAAAAYEKATAKLDIPPFRKTATVENAKWFMRQGYVLVTVGGANGNPALEAAKALVDQSDEQG